MTQPGPPPKPATTVRQWGSGRARARASGGSRRSAGCSMGCMHAYGCSMGGGGGHAKPRRCRAPSAYCICCLDAHVCAGLGVHAAVCACPASTHYYNQSRSLFPHAPSTWNMHITTSHRLCNNPSTTTSSHWGRHRAPGRRRSRCRPPTQANAPRGGCPWPALPGMLRACPRLSGPPRMPRAAS